MSDTQIPLYPDGHYHIYNHAVGKENLFDDGMDYAYFLKYLQKYILPITDVFAYTLMPNHFHIVVRIKSENEIKRYLQSLSKRPINFVEMEKKNNYFLCDKISQIYSNCFNAYAKHCNFWKRRTGTLFKRAFRRIEIKDMQYLQRLICYVHQNPVEAGFVFKPDDWKYSSYNAIISSNHTLIARQEVIELFGDLKNFVYCNSKPTDIDIG